MNQDTISIILPIYHRENTIKRCIDSILSQTYENFELVIVKVKSEDNTPKICKKYAKKDDRIRLLDGSNQTRGGAANVGMQAAKGRWVMFLDGADYLEKDFLMNLEQQRNETQAEMIVNNFYDIYRECEPAYEITVNREITREAYLTELMKDPSHDYFGGLWNKLYDLELIRANSIRFSDKVEWGEDFIFNMQYLAFAEHIYISDQSGCYYMQRDVVADSGKEWNLIDGLNHRNYMYAAYKTLFWRLKLYDTYKKTIEQYMIRQASLEFARIVFPFSFKGWCLIRKKCLQDNQLNTMKNRWKVIIEGVKLRF